MSVSVMGDEERYTGVAGPCCCCESCELDPEALRGMAPTVPLLVGESEGKEDGVTAELRRPPGPGEPFDWILRPAAGRMNEVGSLS